MATDQETRSTSIELSKSAVIDNELSDYRAISPRAVLSLLCGLLSLFSLAHPYFFVFAVLAVILGVTADRNIKRYSDMLTGRGIAQAGMGIGLIFGLGIGTVFTVQSLVRTYHAENFARYYANVLKSGTMGDMFWYSMAPNQRKGLSSEEVMEKMAAAKRQDSPAMEMRNGPFKALKKRLSSSNYQEIHFVKMEGQASEDLTNVAFALFEVHGPTSKEYPDEHEYALAILKNFSDGKKSEWWVESFTYPYKPASFVPPEKAADDGHGH